MCFKYKKLITLGFLGVGGLVGSQLWIPYLLGTSVDRAYEKISSDSTDFNILLILLSILSLALFIFSPAVVTVFAPGFLNDNEKFNLTVDLTRWMSPYLFFINH